MPTNPMTKAVILARGLGTRMRKTDDDATLTAEQAAIAQAGVKAMIPIDRPFLDYVLNDLADAGYTDVCLVIGPEHDQVRDYYTNKVELNRLTVEFAIQEKPLGTADAVAAAESFAGHDPFLVINSDNYYPPQALAGLRDLTGPGLAAFDRDAMLADSNIPADRIAKFAVIEVNSDGCMHRVIEKPDQKTLASLPEPVCCSMNCWRFEKSIFQACRNIKPSPRGELEITDAVQYTIDQLNDRYAVLTVYAPVLDMSCQADIPAVAAKLKGQPVNL